MRKENYIRQDDVIRLILPRLRSARAGSIEYQRLSAILDGVNELPVLNTEDALKKQLPMDVTDIHIDEYFCPACGAENNCDDGIVADRYCPCCGQALKTDDNDT